MEERTVEGGRAEGGAGRGGDAVHVGAFGRRQRGSGPAAGGVGGTEERGLLRSTFHGYVHLELSGGFGHSREVRKSWERSLGALHVLLDNWPPRPDGSD
ncbi:TetR-like C-terminal domain-containing protein [Streptomyces sp. NPDC059985]|uniref:TetR-like C-terminal domain-containing protein n=1 Tax=Streptomyces sp. NPDC059985 TaxID=3347025 RepID=UPI00369045EA